MDIGHLRAFNRFSSIGQWMAILVFLRFLSRISRRMAESNEEREKTNERATQLNAPSDFLLPVQWPFRLVRVARKIVCTCTASHLFPSTCRHTHTTQGPIDWINAQQMNATSSAHFYQLLILPVFCEQIASSRRSVFLSFFLSFAYFHPSRVCVRARAFSIRVVRFGREQ